MVWKSSRSDGDEFTPSSVECTRSTDWPTAASSSSKFPSRPSLSIHPPRRAGKETEQPHARSPTSQPTNQPTNKGRKVNNQVRTQRREHKDAPSNAYVHYDVYTWHHHKPHTNASAAGMMMRQEIESRRSRLN
mmetsp:Transcript_17206/g.48382  ORF Transcript_17206/g.48382 Transcript_17206/m.48382 type:complete len:133 (+) Transcript_17206:640-1038(+)